MFEQVVILYGEIRCLSLLGKYIDLAKPKSGAPLYVLSVFCFCFVFFFIVLFLLAVINL